MRITDATAMGGLLFSLQLLQEFSFLQEAKRKAAKNEKMIPLVRSRFMIGDLHFKRKDNLWF